MDGNIICKTLLYAYKDLEWKSKMVDKELLKVAVRSASRPIYEAFDKCANLLMEKQAYCNIKVIIDEAIKETNGVEELKYRYVDGLKLCEIAEKVNYSIQCVETRSISQCDKLFETMLNKYGSRKMLEQIAKSRWLKYKYIEFIKLDEQNRKGEE